MYSISGGGDGYDGKNVVLRLHPNLLSPSGTQCPPPPALPLLPLSDQQVGLPPSEVTRV